MNQVTGVQKLEFICKYNKIIMFFINKIIFRVIVKHTYLEHEWQMHRPTFLKTLQPLFNIFCIDIIYIGLCVFDILMIFHPQDT